MLFVGIKLLYWDQRQAEWLRRIKLAIAKRLRARISDHVICLYPARYEVRELRGTLMTSKVTLSGSEMVILDTAFSYVL